MKEGLMIFLIVFILTIIRESEKKMIKEMSDIVGGGSKHSELIVWLIKAILLLVISYFVLN